jgi:hypothetical protein
MAMRKRLLPPITLALIIPFLTELLSGNTSAPAFIRPWTYAMLVLAYGVPALLIRDLFVRWRLALPGLFILGLAYGIYNEGILAKTLLRNEGVPMNAFDHYSALGVNWPWAFLIVPWHALQAILFPIALVAWLFPDARSETWLSRGVFAAGVLIALVFGCFVFFVNPDFKASPVYLAFFWAVIGLLILLSRLVPRGVPFLCPGGRATLGPLLAGFFFYPFFILGMCVLAGSHAPALVICLGATILLGAGGQLVTKRQWLTVTPFVLLALGNYLSASLFNLRGVCLKGSPLGILAALVLIGLFAGCIRALWRR